MTIEQEEGSAGLGISKSAWLRYATDVTSRWFQHRGGSLVEMEKFGAYLREQRYRVGIRLAELSTDLDIPYEHLVLLEQGMLRPSEVPAGAWVRLMRVLEGREELVAPPTAVGSEYLVAESVAQVPAAADEPQAPAVTMPLEGSSEPGPIGVARVRAIGVGGGGSNAVARMYRQRIPGVEYLSVNTDAQHLLRLDVPEKLRIGDQLTRGLGVGGNPDLGLEAAEESREELYEAVRGCDLVFIAAGMGGGTGTGAAPVVADIARQSGALTIAVVTKPFSFEGRKRMQQAEAGVQAMRDKVDTLILIPNDRLLTISDEHMTAENAFKLADEVLRQGVQSIAELVTIPGEINLDFADVKTIMSGAGPAWMAIGYGRGEGRAVAAAKAAIASPLLDAPIEGARRVLLNITGGTDLTLQEVQQAADFVSKNVDPEANIIFGMVTDPKMEDEVRVTVIATDLPIYDEDVLKTGSLEMMLEETVGEVVQEEVERTDLGSFLRRFRSKGRKQ